MLFNSFQYLLFLPVVVLAYWLVPRKLKPVLLLAASYYFYMSWMKAYGLLLLGLTVGNYFLGLGIDKCANAKARRLVLIGGIAANLGCLGIFKYSNFIYSSLLQLKLPLASWLAVDSGHYPLPIILPLGISFFVFEFIHYLSDIYKGHKPIVSPVRFGLFAAFFPSQIAGPIKRYQDFEKQLDKLPAFNAQAFQEGIELIIQGLFKKVVLGDNLAPLVQTGFSAPLSMGVCDAWLCALAFALQIYFDFSGYTDIGRGSALLMGFRLPPNFNMPYLATSLSDFWHRWHISLSTWLRDYLYIPLGGSRTTDLRAASNLLATMLLGGLWHGASWHFVIWGGYHGLGLALERWFRSLWLQDAGAPRRDPVATSNIAHVAFKISSAALTFLVVIIGWVLFRADNLGQAMQFYQAMFWLTSSVYPTSAIALDFWHSTLPTAFVVYVFVLSLASLRRAHHTLTGTRGTPLRGLVSWLHRVRPTMPARVVAVLFAGLIIVGLSSAKSVPFIYFQF